MELVTNLCTRLSVSIFVLKLVLVERWVIVRR